MKILNLDAFAEPKRSFTFKGTSYPVLDIDVQSFINNLTVAEALEADGRTASAVESMKLALAMIESAVPGLPAAERMKLGVEQVSVLMRFIRGEFDTQAFADSMAEEVNKGVSEGEKKQP